MAGIRIQQPGLFTTVQDLGRWGYGQFGMSVAGAMDAYAMRVGNILLGNPENAPVLEMTLLGPSLIFDGNAYFTLTGADLQPSLNGQSIDMWNVHLARSGDRLTFGGTSSGCRAYFAVAGGFDVLLVMGSASTYLRGTLGGYQGRALQAGDRLASKPLSSPALPGFTLPKDKLPDYHDTIRVILGPQDDAFTQEGLNTFFSAEYIVSPQADRMGYRLEGPQIEHADSADIISDGIALGAIQVPSHGQPIIMLADRQTTGGYTKIANVISVDIPSVAQKKPGDTLRFEQISIEDAQQLYREQEAQLADLIQIMNNTIRNIPRYTIVVHGQTFQGSIQELQ